MIDKASTYRWLAVILALQVADVLSTNSAISASVGEINPVMAWAQAHLGGAWWLAKLVFLTPLVICLLRLPTKCSVVVATLVFAVVCNNVLWAVL